VTERGQLIARIVPASPLPPQPFFADPTYTRAFGCVKPESLLRVLIQELTDALTEDGANQDVGIKDNQLNGPQLFCAGATP